MKILLLETSSEFALLASIEGDRIVELRLSGGPDLSKTLGARLQELLEQPYTGSDSKIELWQGGALNLDQALPAPKQLNLNKLSDAGGFKFSGCPTQPETIFESRAVYDRIVVGIGPGSFTGTRVGASMADALALGWKIPLYVVSSLTAYAPDTVAVDARMGGIYIQKNFEEPRLYPLEEAKKILERAEKVVSPHPEKIIARIEGLAVEKRTPDALAMVKRAVEAPRPLKLYY